MTKEEAIDCLQGIKEYLMAEHIDEEAIDMAIEALSADVVSREAHYDAVANRITDMEERGFVSVVRCKDCRHYGSDGGALMVCDVSDMVVDDTDYCSYGERGEK